MTFILFETGSAKWLRKITDDPRQPVQWHSDFRKATAYSHACSLAEAVTDMGVQQYADTIIPHTTGGEPFPPIPDRPVDFPATSSSDFEVFRAIVRRNPHWGYLVGSFETNYTLLVRRGRQLQTVQEWTGTALAEIDNTIRR